MLVLIFNWWEQWNFLYLTFFWNALIHYYILKVYVKPAKVTSKNSREWPKMLYFLIMYSEQKTSLKVAKRMKDDEGRLNNVDF